MKTIFHKALFLTLTVIMLLPVYVMAGGGPGFSTDVDDGCDVPLDGGLSLLAAAGVGYTIKMVSSYRKKKQNENTVEGN